MSCLTKKSLFFMILSIVGNPTFSDRTAECKANVHKVFLESIEPVIAFKLGIFLLSEKFIRSMTTTDALSNYLLNQCETFKEDFDPIDHFRDIGIEIGNQNITFSESQKDDIIGYFKFLINKFRNVFELIKVRANSPEECCLEDFDEFLSECRITLSFMFSREVSEIQIMEADKAFIHCYLNYSFPDFKNESIFSGSGSSSSRRTSLTPDQRKFQKLQLDIMETYYSHLMEKANWFAMNEFEMDPKLFPTVEEYCSGPGQSRTWWKTFNSFITNLF